jgi:hypothetical protein
MTLSNPTDDAALAERLLGMTTATATNMLNLRGYQHQFMSGARARPPAFTGTVPFHQAPGQTAGRAGAVPHAWRRLVLRSQQRW